MTAQLKPPHHMHSRRYNALRGCCCCCAHLVFSHSMCAYIRILYIYMCSAHYQQRSHTHTHTAPIEVNVRACVVYVCISACTMWCLRRRTLGKRQNGSATLRTYTFVYVHARTAAAGSGPRAPTFVAQPVCYVLCASARARVLANGHYSSSSSSLSSLRGRARAHTAAGCLLRAGLRW